jgi:hypothetical protein
MTDTANIDRNAVARDETDRLISSEKVDGTAVYNLAGDHLGSIHHMMLDKFTGQVAYAVLSFGGFMGMGESYHPLPWRMLKYEPRRAGYVVDLDRNRLAGAPRFQPTGHPDWSDPGYRRRIDAFWMPSL